MEKRFVVLVFIFVILFSGIGYSANICADGIDNEGMGNEIGKIDCRDPFCQIDFSIPNKEGIDFNNEIIDSSNCPYFFHSKIIDVDSNNKPYVVYICDNKLKYAKRIPFGWIKTDIGNAENFYPYSSMIIDSQDNIHVVYIYGNNLKYIKKTGNIWGNPEDVDIKGVEQNANFLDLSITVDSNNIPHIVYLYNYNVQSGQDAGPNYKLKYATKSGSSWTREFVPNLGDPNNMIQNPQIAAYSQSGIQTIHILFTQDDDINKINQIKKDINHNIWTDKSLIFSNSNTDNYLESIDNKDYNIRIIYKENNNRLNYTTYTGTNWNSPQGISSQISSFSSIGLDSLSNAHILFAYANEIKYVSTEKGINNIKIAGISSNIGSNFIASIAVKEKYVHYSYIDGLNSGNLVYGVNIFCSTSGIFGTTEINCFDGMDNDYDGNIDCADSECTTNINCCIDQDDDSYNITGGTCGTIDCDDTIADDPIGINCPTNINNCDISTTACAICKHPSATEICGDGIDQDCSGTDLTCPISPCTDLDNDNYGTGDTTGCSHPEIDCNDNNKYVYPTNLNPNCNCVGSPQTEICNDNIDNNCNGNIDNWDQDCKVILPDTTCASSNGIKCNYDENCLEHPSLSSCSDQQGNILSNCFCKINNNGNYLDDCYKKKPFITTSDSQRCCLTGNCGKTEVTLGGSSNALKYTECKDPNEDGIGVMMTERVPCDTSIYTVYGKVCPEEDDHSKCCQWYEECTFFPSIEKVPFYTGISVILTILILTIFYWKRS